MTHVIQAESTAGHRHELRTCPDSPDAACAVAGRVAKLLGTIGTAGTWRGGRVVAVEASTGRLVVVARIVAPRAARRVAPG